MKIRINKLTILTLLIFSSYVMIQTSPIIAATIPDKEELRTQIINTAEQKTAPLTQQNQPATNTEITNTGDDTSSSSNTTSTDTTEVNNNNDTSVNQNVNANANTGYNQADGNISINGEGAGIITTGDAIINVNGEVNAGNNTTYISGSSPNSGNNSDITNTGKSVTASSTSSNTQYVIVNNGNKTVINQVANTTATTGGNSARGNIALNGGPAGVITTGNASTNVNFLVTANGNVTLIGGSGGNGPGTGASIIINNAGRYGKFTTSSQNTHYIVVNNNNRAVISQMCGYPIGINQRYVDASTCSAITGNNNSSGNIAYGSDAGVITTGDAILNISMEANANNNKNYITTSSSGVRSSTDITNTGDDVSAATSSNSKTSTIINNTNSAYVDQNVNAVAETGRNKANGNISFGGRAGVITTGDAIINVNMKADVNNNETYISESSASLADPSNTTQVYNTGDNTTVITSTNTTKTTIVTNDNYLDSNQKVESISNTGDNIASGNIGDGAGIIQTGSIDSDITLDVNGNTNVTGDPVLIAALLPTPSTPFPSPQPTSTSTTQNTSSQSNPVITAPLTAEIAGIAVSKNTTSESAGSVLGAIAKKLPATGVDSIMTVFVITSMLIIGLKLKKAFRAITN